LSSEIEVPIWHRRRQASPLSDVRAAADVLTPSTNLDRSCGCFRL